MGPDFRIPQAHFLFSKIIRRGFNEFYQLIIFSMNAQKRHSKVQQTHLKLYHPIKNLKHTWRSASNGKLNLNNLT